MAVAKSLGRFLVLLQVLTRKAQNGQITRNKLEIRAFRFFRGFRVKDFLTLQ
jgi:hypothetical protein